MNIDWDSKVIEMLNEFVAFEKYTKSILMEPFTGAIIHFTSNELVAFYFFVCKKVDTNVNICSYYDFYTPHNLALALEREFSKS